MTYVLVLGLGTILNPLVLKYAFACRQDLKRNSTSKKFTHLEACDVLNVQEACIINLRLLMDTV